MIQNFGSPTWFVALSCAEYDWFKLQEQFRLSYSDKIAPNSIAELCSSDSVAIFFTLPQPISSSLETPYYE